MIGDWNDPSTRLLDDNVVRTIGIGFDRLRRIPAERRTLELGMSMQGGVVAMQKLDEATGRPEATVSLPIAPHQLRIAIEWPLPGAAGWTAAPSKDHPWTIAPGELFDLAGKDKLDCNSWLGQQLVMFDRRGITLKDVIRMVATFEGAHSINISRLLQAQNEKPQGPFKHPERHILDNVTVFGMKYTHIVVIEMRPLSVRDAGGWWARRAPGRREVAAQTVVRNARPDRILLRETELAWFLGRTDSVNRHGRALDRAQDSSARWMRDAVGLAPAPRFAAQHRFERALRTVKIRRLSQRAGALGLERLAFASIAWRDSMFPTRVHCPCIRSIQPYTGHRSRSASVH